MSKILLIPTARLLPPELQCDFGQIPSAMVPLAGRPALWHISAPYVRAGYDVVLAVEERADCIERYVASSPDCPARTVRVGPVAHLGDTVLQALEQLGSCGELVVNFGDTLVGDGLLAGDQFYQATNADLFRWTTFNPDEQGRIAGVVDRNHPKKPNGHRVFVGAFAFADPARLLSLLRKYASTPEPDLDPFYSAVRDYYRGVEAGGRAARDARQWFDLGHLDTYYAARRRCFMGERAFNSLEVDRRRGTLIKRSRDPKLLQEIGWYLGLPPELAHVAPRIFRHSCDPHDAFVEMEFYGYPPLAEAYAFGQVELGVWREILQSIAFLVASLQRVQTAPLTEALFDMYVRKTRLRLERAMASPHLARLGGRPLTINGTRCLSVDEVLQDLPETAARLGLLAAPKFTVIHGDLCLANILYDRRSGVVRLVDPRGCFGGNSIYGDPRYDLAKLSHSFNGGYDLLVNGLFTLRGEGAEYTLTPYRSEHHQAIAGLFSQMFLPAQQAAQIRLIESTLFLSMVPLHADRPRAQQAFLLQGLRLYAEIRARQRPARVAARVPARLAACTS